MSNKKEFKSVTGEPVRLSLLDGHVTWVKAHWTELDERFHSAAYASGCISKDMMRNQVSEKIPAKVVERAEKAQSFESKVLNAIDELVKANDLDKFNKSGKPDAQILATMVGERVTSAKRDELWYKYQQENGYEDDE